jgi:hypothetical protein
VARVSFGVSRLLTAIGGNMQRGTTYYVVSTRGGEYPPGLEDGDDTRLVAFTDRDEAMERAQRESARTGEDTHVAHMQPYEVQREARRLGFEYIVIVHRDGSRDVELVDEDE